MPSTAIVFATDERYAGPLQGTIRSLTAHLGDGEASLFVAAVDLSRSAKDDLARAARPFDVAFIPLSTASLAVTDFSLNPQLTPATVARLRIPDLLPASIARALYLDVDVLVRRPLTELLRTPLKDQAIAAVQDPAHPWLGSGGETFPWRVFGLDPRMPYCNTGVLLIDLVRWRAQDLTTRTLRLLAEHQLRWIDQDAVNGTLVGDWHHLPPTWNMLAPFHGTGQTYVHEAVDALDEALADPRIVHFAGAVKPWTFDGRTLAFADEWLAHFLATPYAEKHRPLRRSAHLRWAAGKAGGRLAHAGATLLSKPARW